MLQQCGVEEPTSTTTSATEESEGARESLAKVEAAVTQLRAVFDAEHGRLVADVARLATQHEQLTREVAQIARLRIEWGALVQLNVGGRTYTTSITTLRRHPDSLLGRMFSGRYATSDSSAQASPKSDEDGDQDKKETQLLPTDEEGRVFIDRNGELFDHVLDYLREGPERWSIPADETLAHRLAQEFEFYQLPHPPERCFLPLSVPAVPKAEATVIFVMGGRNDELGQTLSVIERFDPVRNEWTTVGSLPTTRNSLAAVISPDGRVLVMGGLSIDISSVGSFDPSQFTSEPVNPEKQTQSISSWRALEGLSTVRNGLAGVTLGKHVYALGGHNNAIYLSSVERYDPTEQGGMWERVAEMSTPRYALGAVVWEGRIYAIGGHNGTAPLASVEVFDPATNKWQTNVVPDMPTARYYLAATVLDGRFYVVGGYGVDSCSTAVECYDPSTNTWTSLAPLPVAKYALAAAAVGGKLYVLGGFDDRTTFATVDCYDPSTNSWSTVADMPTAKYALASVAC